MASSYQYVVRVMQSRRRVAVPGMGSFGGTGGGEPPGDGGSEGGAPSGLLLAITKAS